MYGEGNGSPNQQPSHFLSNENKGLGISSGSGSVSTNNVLSVGGGGIRGGIASLGLTPSNNSSLNETSAGNNHSNASGAGSTVQSSRMMAGGRRNRRV